MAPRFSVVLPVRNQAESVGCAVVGVLGQTFADVELVVVDASSIDDTLDAVKLVADPRVRIDHAADIASARASGLRAARGEWVTVIDADTVARPQWLARVGRLADSTGAEVVCCGGIQHHWDHSTSEVPPSPHHTRPGSVVARRRRSSRPHSMCTPEQLLDWYEAPVPIDGSPDEKHLRWANDAIATLGSSPIPAPDLLARYATVAGLSAARLHRRAEARRMLSMARRIRWDDLRSWSRWAIASVPGLFDLLGGGLPVETRRPPATHADALRGSARPSTG